MRGADFGATAFPGTQFESIQFRHFAEKPGLPQGEYWGTQQTGG
jgi:hypothetical protein